MPLPYLGKDFDPVERSVWYPKMAQQYACSVLLVLRSKFSQNSWARSSINFLSLSTHYSEKSPSKSKPN